MFEDCSHRQNAVSPVVAVILMVAVTVILSAVIGTFVLNLGGQVGSQSAQDIGISTSYAHGQYTATVVTGDTDELRLLVNGSVVENITDVSAGDSLSANVSVGADVTIVSVSGDEETVVLSQTVSTSPTSESSTSSTVSAPTEGLEAHWEFETGSGSTAHDSSGGHDGSLVNETSWLSPGRVGDYALSFDGKDDSVRIPDSSNFTTSNVTLAAWVKLINSDGDHAVVLGSGGGWSDEGYHLMRLQNSSGNPKKMRFEFQDSGGSKLILDSDKPINESRWYHIVATYNATTDTAKLYINGTLNNQTTKAVSQVNPPSDMGIAYNYAPNYGGDYWPGHIDDARIYTRTLSKNEVQDLYNATK